MSIRRGSVVRGNFQEVEEREVISRRQHAEASPLRRPRERSPQPRYESEIVQPGGIYVDVDDGGPQRRPRIVQTHTYRRDRDRLWYSSTER
ncbi:hypothetical protein CLCR_06477 [Cladophialophora carrionii]|uniref:Uncharacterized protein n=1 Tax=Cladophialophora carrionii TaxID=86049 RepID=A0A1C1C9V6_9EURO|nr:hypothetical protein CLCR_06477 [Cladophialophora carrionii]